jgi:hypothetical protein
MALACALMESIYIDGFLLSSGDRAFFQLFLLTQIRGQNRLPLVTSDTRAVRLWLRALNFRPFARECPPIWPSRKEIRSRPATYRRVAAYTSIAKDTQGRTLDRHGVPIRNRHVSLDFNDHSHFRIIPNIYTYPIYVGSAPSEYCCGKYRQHCCLTP